MVGNWRLGNDSKVKEAFWPELQNVLLGRKDAKTRWPMPSARSPAS
jgi:hypothetical protein